MQLVCGLIDNHQQLWQIIGRGHEGDAELLSSWYHLMDEAEGVPSFTCGNNVDPGFRKIQQCCFANKSTTVGFDAVSTGWQKAISKGQWWTLPCINTPMIFVFAGDSVADCINLNIKLENRIRFKFLPLASSWNFSKSNYALFSTSVSHGRSTAAGFGSSSLVNVLSESFQCKAL